MVITPACCLPLQWPCARLLPGERADQAGRGGGHRGERQPQRRHHHGKPEERYNHALVGVFLNFANPRSPTVPEGPRAWFLGNGRGVSEIEWHATH